MRSAPTSYSRIHVHTAGADREHPAGRIPGDHEVLIMASKTSSFYSPKLSAAENRAVNERIRKSWKDGREAGRRATFAQLYSSNRIKEGTR